jgi:diaminopimelate epimerase
MDFWKYSALGNTFLVIPTGVSMPGAHLSWVETACDPEQGVCADGVVLVHVPSARLSIYNADGGRAEISGNGARCASAWWFSEQEQTSTQIEWRTDAGRVECARKGRHAIEVQLPAPSFEAERIPARTRKKELWNHALKHGSKPLSICALSVGNPQCVVWGRSIPRNWFETGEMLSEHRLFPEQTNVVFARRIADELEVRFWERGVGETAASGTGAAAAVVTGARLGKTPRKTRVHMPGGTVSVNWKKSGEIMLSGRVELVAMGDLALKVKGL